MRVVIVEDGSRFARDLLTQELGIMQLIKRGITVLTASGDNLTDTSDDMRVAMRQFGGIFNQLEKKRLVRKLRAARERLRAEGRKVEGRKPLAKSAPRATAMARELRRESPRMSLRKISAALAAAGFISSTGAPYTARSIQHMLDGAEPVIA